jgi:HK97 family phage prohead protease/HK97 family phage major capsid protein
MIRFTSDRITIKAEAGDEGERRIDAVAVPYNTFATVSDGQEVMFAPGSLPVDGKAPRVFMYHDSTKPVGIVAERIDTEEGMLASMKISRTALGDEALTLAADGVMDVSVGVNVIRAKADKQGRLVIEAAEWLELSLVPIPAFAGATVLDVAAEAGTTSPDEEPEPTDPVEEIEVEATQPEPQPIEAAATPTPLFAQPRREFRMPSAAEYIAASSRGGADFAQLNANIRAAAGDELTTDVPGLLPTPVVSPIYDDIRPLRPVVSALGPRSMPGAGKVFIRPKITTHTEVGEQSTELTALDKRTMVVDDVQVTKKTFGGQVTLSEQTIDWSDPSMLSAVLTDLAGQYALATEAEAITTMAAEIDSNNREVTDLTDAAEVVADIYAVAALIASVGNYLPTHLICSPSVWAKLGALKDQQDRPVFPQTSPINGIGNLPNGAGGFNGNPLGLQLIVSNQITTQSIQGNDAEDYLFVANARFMEVYEQQKGAISIEVPSTLGRTLAFRGYFASVVMDPKLVWALGPAV